MQQTSFKLEKERELGEIITDTFAFVRIHFKDLTQVFMQTILPILLLSVAAGIYYQYASQKIVGDNILIDNDPFDLLRSFTTIIIPTLLAIFSSLFLFVISGIAILASVKSVQQFGKIEVQFVKTEIKTRFWSMTGLSVISFLSLMVAAVFCFLPFVYLIVPVSIMFPLLVIEEKSVGDSFSYAFTLIKENYWITLGTLIVLFIILALASLIFQLPILIYTIFSTVTKLEASTVDYNNLIETDWVLLSLTAVGNFGSNILSLVSLIASALIYFNLNEKHNLTGTAKDIDTIGSN